MSAFSDALLIASKHEGLNQVGVAELCGVDQTLVSRWLADKTPPNRNTLRSIYEGFAKRNPVLAVELVVAYLHDEARASGIHSNRLVIAAADSELPPDIVKVPKELRDCFSMISDACVYPEVAAVVRSHGDLCKFHIAARADSETLAKIAYPNFKDANPPAHNSELGAVAEEEGRIDDLLSKAQREKDSVAAPAPRGRSRPAPGKGAAKAGEAP